ncbi:MAG: transketolase [Azonexus sp.]
MRKQFVKSVTDLLANDPERVLLLGDIGVFGFHQAASDFPGRVINIGILEQATVSMAAGMALTGMKPIVHTIAPFLVERAYEQLKTDFGYQKLSGTFVSVGGSFDYSSLGCTHHCPGDVNLIENIDGFNILIPGHPEELAMIMSATSHWGNNYIRLSEKSNAKSVSNNPLRPTVVRKGYSDHPVVVAVGPCLDMVMDAVGDLPVTVYYTVAVKPFPAHELQLPNKNVIVVEPYYSSQLAHRIAWCNSSPGWTVNARTFSLPRRFIEEYGDPNRINISIGFYANALRVEIKQWITSPKSFDMTPRA